MLPGYFTELKDWFEAAEELKNTMELLGRLVSEVEHSDAFILRSTLENRRGECVDFSRTPTLAASIKSMLEAEYALACKRFEDL
jgi:hypothetical protein